MKNSFWISRFCLKFLDLRFSVLSCTLVQGGSRKMTRYLKMGAPCCSFQVARENRNSTRGNSCSKKCMQNAGRITMPPENTCNPFKLQKIGFKSLEIKGSLRKRLRWYECEEVHAGGTCMSCDANEQCHRKIKTWTECCTNEYRLVAEYQLLSWARKRRYQKYRGFVQVYFGTYQLTEMWTWS